MINACLFNACLSPLPCPPQAWSAICKVWASKWTERAWLSRKARGVKDDELYMAVLLQQVWKAWGCGNV